MSGSDNRSEDVVTINNAIKSMLQNPLGKQLSFHGLPNGWDGSKGLPWRGEIAFVADPVLPDYLNDRSLEPCDEGFVGSVLNYKTKSVTKDTGGFDGKIDNFTFHAHFDTEKDFDTIKKNPSKTEHIEAIKDNFNVYE